MEGRTWCSKPPSVRCFLTLSGNNTASQLCLPSAPRCCKGKRGSRSTVPRAPHPVLSHGGLGLGGALLLRSEMTPHRPAKAITTETRGEVPGGRLAMGPLLPQSRSPRTTPPPAALPFLGPALRKLLLTSQRSSSRPQGCRRVKLRGPHLPALASPTARICADHQQFPSGSSLNQHPGRPLCSGTLGDNLQSGLEDPWHLNRLWFLIKCRFLGSTPT